MATTPTINQFNVLFKDIAMGHEMINDYGIGPTYNINNEVIKYPF